MALSLAQFIRDCLGNQLLTSKNTTELASFIKDNYSTSSSISSIRVEIYKQRKKLENPVFYVDKKDTEPPIKTPYTVNDSGYTFEARKGTFTLSVELIDNLFYEYSEHGLNMQSTELIRKHRLEVWQWYAIKNALRLYKKSHIFSPYTVEITPTDQIQSMVDDKMGNLVKDINYQVVKSYQHTIHKQYKDVIRKQSLRDYEIETIITELQDWLPTCNIVPQVPIAIDNTGDEISVFISDIHFGGENKGSRLSMFSPEVLETVFDQIAKIINQQKSKKVNIFFAGDFIETFSGLNHMDSWQGVAEGYWGAEVVKKCYKFLLRFISKVNNVVKILGVAGNHDRASASNKEDTTGFIADLIFEFLRISLSEKIEVLFDKRLISQEIDDICIIMTHGHEKISNMNASELILEYGMQYKFNLLVSGHLHNRQIKNDSKNLRQIVLPSIIPGNNYSQGAGYSSAQSGFVIVKNNGFGKINLTDYSL